MTPSRTHLVILGCGWAARLHSRTLRGRSDVALSYASRDGARADQMRRRFGGVRSYRSYDDAMADPAVDVVLVATPTATHRELVLRALAAGKHVIVEKPAFMAACDVDVVRGAARRMNRRVLVAENYYYKPIARYLRDVVGSGALGDVRFVSINATKRQELGGWRDDPAMSGGGALFEAGVHWINFAANIGLEALSAQGFAVGSPDQAADRSSLVVVRYANGAAGTIAHSWELAAPFGGLRLSKVQGTRGAVTFESNGIAQVTSGPRRSIGLPGISDLLGYRAMFDDFFRALRTGRQERFTLEMARRDLELLEQAAVGMAGDATAVA